MNEIKSLGILGGTFDPIHYGHLTAAECARCEYKLDRVVFMLSAQPPHKQQQTVTDPQDRLSMVRKAIADNEAFEASTLEMERKGYSYTVDTIQYYLNTYPDVKIYFILGIDALLLINTWKNVDRLVGMCEFIAITRPGFKLDPEDDAFKDVPRVLWQHMHILEMPGSVVSSSDIRNRVANGKTIKYLVPPQIEEYIRTRGLYREETTNDERK
ncbi:MAG TPA: nicotinate-nucleotide adenylyltransferase [Syntrophomonadaceae bacterium]|nr:nicotinate-nucleotide adenylyltransferase [Syntrophomonadaceae bacterium]